MADMDVFIEEIEKAAAEAGLECKADEAQMLFTVRDPSRQKKTGALVEKMYCGLQTSIAEVKAAPEGGERSLAQSKIAAVQEHLKAL